MAQEGILPEIPIGPGGAVEVTADALGFSLNNLLSSPPAKKVKFGTFCSRALGP